MTIKTDILYETRMEGTHDRWGTCMSWLFAIADYIEHTLYDEVPPEWEYKSSPLGANDEAYEYQLLCKLEPTLDDLKPIMGILYRYRGLLELAGHSY